MLVLPGFSSVKDGVHLDGLELLLFLVKNFLHLSIAFEMKLFSKMSLDNTGCMHENSNDESSNKFGRMVLE